jgi:hypothetical protein
MALTPTQLQTLRGHIDASADLNVYPNNLDGAYEIARLLNVAAAPTFIVWRTSVTWDEIMLNGMDWARVDNLSVGKARIWDWMFQNGSRSFNPSKPNIRTGIEAVWVGTAADLAVRAAVYVHCKRATTRAEKLFATGTGSDAVPGTLTFEGAITPNDVEEARR